MSCYISCEETGSRTKLLFLDIPWDLGQVVKLLYSGWHFHPGCLPDFSNSQSSPGFLLFLILVDFFVFSYLYRIVVVKTKPVLAANLL